MGNKRVAVIGGGPAGLMAAGYAALNKNDVTLFERNNKAGKKLLITGKGRCNITNYGTIEELIESFSETGSFLYSSFSQFSNHDVINFFNKLGVETKVERGKRVFPKSDRASEVLHALLSFAKSQGVKFQYNSRVIDIITKDNHVSGLKIEGESLFYPFDRIIIATGGKSYSKTGSTGDGYLLAKKLGHTVTAIKPSLVPLITGERWLNMLQGLSLKNVKLMAYQNNNLIAEDFGEMLFTHFGISGPIVLSISRSLVELLPGRVDMVLDLKPALDKEILDGRLLRDIEKNMKKQIKNYATALLPNKLILPFLNKAKIDPEKRMYQITREERGRIVDTLKEFTFTVINYRPLDEAIVTRGGISRKEIFPKTMESKIIGGLFFCGEVIDIDGLTGGYNLQAAFSTGYVAGNWCGKE